MKYSKQLTRWQRKKSWSEYLIVTSVLKVNRKECSFESWCKTVINLKHLVKTRKNEKSNLHIYN